MRRRLPVGDPRRHSTGSAWARPSREWAHSFEIGFLRAGDALCEPFALGPLVQVVPHDPLHVVGELVARDLVTTQFTAEARVESEASTEMHLEALDLVSVGVGD